MDHPLAHRYHAQNRVIPLGSTWEQSQLWTAFIFAALKKGAWASFFILLPFTSFPHLPSIMGGSAVVRPLSLYPLAILFVVVTLPALIKRPIPRTFLSLIPFLVIAIISSLISLFYGIEPVLGIAVTDRVIRNLMTLAIGTSIYLTISLMHRREKDLEFSLKCTYIGMAFALLWGSFQALYIIDFNQNWFDNLSAIQQFVSVRRLFVDRISGLTYEPNWYAEQICVLLLPWLITSVLQRRSVFQYKFRGVTIEWLLLGWSVVLLPFTYSRAGIMSMVVLAILSILVFKPSMRFRMNNESTSKNNSARNRLIKKLGYLLQILLIILVLAAPIYLIGSRNPFFARVWEYWERKNVSIEGYMSYLGFGARLAYSQAAISTYEAYPLLGVGLGNYVFYFEEMLPYRPLSESPEVLHILTPEHGRDRMITAKNFFLRLLAETGVIGFAAFCTFLIAILGCTLYLWFSPRVVDRFWGTGGLIGLLAFLLASISFDSFALPNMWIVFGLITSSAWISSQDNRSKPM